MCNGTNNEPSFLACGAIQMVVFVTELSYQAEMHSRRWNSSVDVLVRRPRLSSVSRRKVSVKRCYLMRFLA